MKSNNLFRLFLLLSVLSSCGKYDVQVSAGRIERFPNFQSKYVDERNIDVWLPDGYSAEKRYATIYMHDGQMLFDSTATWNKQEWGVDEVISDLITQKKIVDCIVIGIWNNGKYRYDEYFPEKPMQYLSEGKKKEVLEQTHSKNVTSQNYLKFIVEELKPFIDRTFSTKSERENTFILGSSMGGLISLYAISEYPEVFGGAVSMSTHWVGKKENDFDIPRAFAMYLDENLPSFETHKLYFDYGTESLDSLYKVHQMMIDTLVQFKGYTDENWMTKKFVGATHDERAWKSRLHIPIEFMLKRSKEE